MWQVRGASFSGSGFLLPYFLGALSALRSVGAEAMNAERGWRFAGASGGALAAMAGACDIPVELLRETISKVNAQLAARPTRAVWALDEVVRTELELLVPDGDEVAEMMTARASIAVAFMEQVDEQGRRSRMQPHVEMVSEFESRQDVIDALAASCYLPGFSAPALTTTFRGRAAFDGGLIAFQPVPGCWRRDEVVKISPRTRT
ncbi:uncharacterized protein AMSG_09083 [Thecamonas trahens ATCC 50062]|uniref:PNPLA domain-containing protein n=1 Tax=Thecamonas trahens ATCC 50062 TaxID=461836 RepID=A0A0L0DLJ4_THETB|nr:hypothetical protein AMSG_09083 [Thecamonas trahens ATCC 50062]KNC52916.1 hypothetical protein AMSG_09083 [Thecamonas trahens ATCC 50062]|eukprot:XP_013754812.1 hypothetical protein AMSG_09083 [Thecamonas trahens ATCC 50062]